MLNQALYGVLARPTARRVVAAVLNWTQLLYFVLRSGFCKRTAVVVAVYGALTILAWRLVPSLVGISAVWCALYGALPAHTVSDHVTFWLTNITTLVVPALLREWGSWFYVIANTAHFASAVSAWAVMTL
jgi:uncharacterized membrane protein YuzA (DUF378 family)